MFSFAAGQHWGEEEKIKMAKDEKAGKERKAERRTKE
jgi:hypothetical protein